MYAGVGGGSGATTTTTVAATSTVQPAAATTTVSSLTQLYKTVTPGVVDITVTSTSSGNGFGSQQTQAEGTGFVYDTKGDIVTAAHVVDGAIDDQGALPGREDRERRRSSARTTRPTPRSSR